MSKRKRLVKARAHNRGQRKYYRWGLYVNPDHRITVEDKPKRPRSAKSLVSQKVVK